MIKGDSASAAKPLGHWAIKGGDATASDGLKTLFDGPRPCAGAPPACVNKANQSWSPMRKFGGIIVRALASCPQRQLHVYEAARCYRQLGIGGDNSHGGVGTFFEGAITAGFSSDATDKALQENIAAAGYARPRAGP